MLVIRRLTVHDADPARALFAVMATAFAEAPRHLSDMYLHRLLDRHDIWVLAAFVDDAVVGGLTAHALPMTRSEATELLIYDLAVQKEYRRLGVARQLISELRAIAAAAGFESAFVMVDNDDRHALAFYEALDGEPMLTTMFTFRRQPTHQPVSP
jgi:aminoglycoside 3-N-acetyltransferase I